MRRKHESRSARLELGCASSTTTSRRPGTRAERADSSGFHERSATGGGIVSVRKGCQGLRSGRAALATTPSGEAVRPSPDQLLLAAVPQRVYVWPDDPSERVPHVARERYRPGPRQRRELHVPGQSVQVDVRRWVPEYLRVRSRNGLTFSFHHHAPAYLVVKMSGNGDRGEFASRSLRCPRGHRLTLVRISVQKYQRRRQSFY
jgi:hypothetical protein